MCASTIRLCGSPQSTVGTKKSDGNGNRFRPPSIVLMISFENLNKCLFKVPYFLFLFRFKCLRCSLVQVSLFTVVSVHRAWTYCILHGHWHTSKCFDDFDSSLFLFLCMVKTFLKIHIYLVVTSLRRTPILVNTKKECKTNKNLSNITYNY